MKIQPRYLVLLAMILGLFACKRTQPKPLEKEALAVMEATDIGLQLISTAVSAPVQLNMPRDGTHRMFITEHGGKIRILKNDSLLPSPFLNLTPPGENPVTNPLGTINSVAFSPNYATDHKFYVSYNAATTITTNPAKLVVSEFTQSDDDPDVADIKSELHVLEVEGSRIFANGAGMAFGPDGYLYINIGDDAFGDSTYVHRAQDLNYLEGKMLRIDVKKSPYAIPPDNPYVGMPGKKPEIWASGLRKMWRFSFDPKTKRLIGADAGESKREEVDIVAKGANYGWPFMEGDTIYQTNLSPDKMIRILPIDTYPTHKDGVCIIGGQIYHGKGIPILKGKYIFGDFNGNLFTLTEDKNGLWTRQKLNVRNKPDGAFLICSLGNDENNELYVMGLTSNPETSTQGALYKITK